MNDCKLAPCNEFDRNLLQRVKAFLYQQGCGPHQSLKISIERGVVVVEGAVPSYYLRQVAIECIKRVAGVIQVVDQIVVTYDSSRSDAGDNSVEQDGCLTSVRLQLARLDLPRTADRAKRSTYERNTQHFACGKE